MDPNGSNRPGQYLRLIDGALAGAHCWCSDLGAALTGLSPELRQALQATVVDGLSTREAARLLGIPPGTVKSRVRIAKARMREQLLEGSA